MTQRGGNNQRGVARWTFSRFHRILPFPPGHFPGTSLKISTFLLVLLAAGLLSACSAPPAPSAARILWPLPPQPPQLEFVGLLLTDHDLDPGARHNETVDLLLGQSPVAVFKRPFGIAAVAPGVIVVGDQLAGKLLRIDFTRGRLRELPVGKALRPLGVAAGQDGRLYVADGRSKTVLTLSADGELLCALGTPETLENPSYVAVNDRLDRVYVADAPRHRIAVFSRSGEHLFDIGGPGNAPGQLAAPQGMAIDSEHRLYVADMLNCRVQVFTADGDPLRSFGMQGLDFWDFEAPRDLALSAGGTLYVLDYRKALLLAYRPDGELRFPLGDGRPTSHPLGFSTPLALTVDAQGRLYVVDQLNTRLSIWQELTGDYLAQHPLQAADYDRLQQAAQTLESTHQVKP